jgi:hypothetical protein
MRFKDGARHWCSISFAHQTAILHTQGYPTRQPRDMMDRLLASFDL